MIESQGRAREWDERMLALDEESFRGIWEAIVGEPPAAILPRAEMLAILRETTDLPDDA